MCIINGFFGVGLVRAYEIGYTWDGYGDWVLTPAANPLGYKY